MFLVSGIKQTQVYQDVWQAGEKLLIVRILTKRFGKLGDRHQTKIESLEITQLEELAEALLDFQAIGDLDHWLGMIGTL